MKKFNKIFITNLIAVVTFCLVNIGSAHAQAREDNSRPSATKTKQGIFNEFDIENVVVGGNLGAQFGTVTIVELAPTVGYKLTDFWLTGVSARYIYFEDKRFIPTFKTNIYGGGVFTQFYFLENFLTHTEYEILRLGSVNSENRRTIDSFLVGGGYRSQIGGSAFASIMLLYNLLDGPDAFYPNPIVRIGFGIGL